MPPATDPPLKAVGDEKRSRMLEVDVALPLGAFSLDARFATGPGITALFGRSGSGKTTVISCVAGLIRPARGRIVADGRVLFDSRAGVDVPRHRRRVGYVFQDARLFPHLNVRQNLLYGRRFAPSDAGTATLGRVVDLLGVGHLLDRRPARLSGGERQRVAIGRALLANPRLLLMDEPLASLDAPRKAEILPYLERLRDGLRGMPVLYVSHSLEEVTRLADSVVAMADGRVVAAGPAGEVLAMPELEPVTGRFEAGALLTARVKGEVEAFALTLLEHPAGELRVPRLGLPPGTAVRLRVRARDVTLALPGDLGALSTRNRLRTRVVAVRPSEDALADVALDAAGEALAARVTREAVAELGLAPGREVVALVKTIAIGRRGVGLAEAGGG